MSNNALNTILRVLLSHEEMNSIGVKINCKNKSHSYKNHFTETRRVFPALQVRYQAPKMCFLFLFTMTKDRHIVHTQLSHRGLKPCLKPPLGTKTFCFS